MSDDVLTSLEACRASLRAAEAAPGELLEEALRRNQALDRGDRPVHAFLSTLEPEAEPADGPRGLAAGESGDESSLRDVPVAVKDNLCTPDLPTTCGSRILEGYRSPFAATVVRRLERAGARVLGKTNLDEFAMGSSTENSGFGPTRNPYDRERVPGGSSGGSAAAVAAGVVPVALGSSTGGSVRQPAAFCGLVGIKPTYGRVSRYGLVAFASSLDQVGVLSRTVRDGAVVLETIAGSDPRDATCQDRPSPRAEALDEVDLEGRVLGLPDEYLGEGLDDGVRALVEDLAREAERAGAEIRRVSLPSTPLAIPCYYVLAPAEASSNLARYDGVRYGVRAQGAPDAATLFARTRGEGFGAEVKRRIMLGTYVLSAGYYDAYYRRAQRLRARIASELRDVFEAGVDALLAPTTPTTAFRLGEHASDPYAMYLADVFTVSANLAGLPAISIPIGTVDGLPVGGQLLCPPWEEERMLGLAARLEERVAWSPPPLASRSDTEVGA
ncbi:MAG: Asp-tRNA(Asn)/Glu-tRNA(Gln) amidotransferase subunit GatA [Candidatus Palauibacterales bacterium]|nr:Asp-tRNA(Asn)/Glu-tRNA(Gln) amidotransferase subunit GatA [Candidatus Palauibacterales bacterium]MDP2582921.1 Asp-tRNA(Asn)/Glu-tRNA(Gln) amidotransferase subunit GatA [Candidatus Palauibacterales bacterium]